MGVGHLSVGLLSRSCENRCCVPPPNSCILGNIEMKKTKCRKVVELSY